MTVHDGKEKSTNWKGTELHELKETPTAQCITETGKFLDSEHSKAGECFRKGEHKCERIIVSHLLCLLRMKFPVLARHAVIFSFVCAHLQEFPHLTFFYLCSKAEQR